MPNYLSQLLSTVFDDVDAYTKDLDKQRDYATLVAKNLDPLKPSGDTSNYAQGLMTIQDIQPGGSYGPVLAYLLNRLTGVTGAMGPFDIAYALTQVTDPVSGEVVVEASSDLIPDATIKSFPLFKIMIIVYNTLKTKGTNTMDFMELIKVAAPTVGEFVFDSSDFDDTKIFEDIWNAIRGSVIKAGGTAPEFGGVSAPPLIGFIDEEPKHHESAGTGANGEPFPTVMESLEMRWIMAWETAVSEKLVQAYGIQPLNPPGFITPLKEGAWDIFKNALGLSTDGLTNETDENKTVFLWNKNGVSKIVQDSHIAMIKEHTENLLDATEADVTSLIVDKMNEGADQIKSPALPPPYIGPIDPIELIASPPTLFDPPMGRAILRWCLANTDVVDIRLGFVKPMVNPAA